jgi:Lanthionine synthetase C-like protein
VLYTPDVFEPLTSTRWSEARARDAIREIVAGADEAMRGPSLLWKADPWDGWQSTSPQKNLYVGAAGMIWALDALGRRGFESTLELPPLATRTLELFRKRPDFIKVVTPPEPRMSAFMLGETGILLVAWSLSPSRDAETALLKRIRANAANDVDELFWGIPGTLHAAKAMHEATKDARWKAAWQESADVLLRRRGDDGLWVQRLYGWELVGLSASHGLVGNVHALLRGGSLLSAARRNALKRDTNAILGRTVVRERKLANWPHRARPPLYVDTQVRLQWCSGGPGVIVSTADFLDEALLLAAAELVWKAGPHGLEKGPGLCHGTAGNGYALLKTFARTGDERWLQRARRFAMHALEQVGRLRVQRGGRGRYSLWTGDVGAALFAADCIDARSSYPVLDSWSW